MDARAPLEGAETSTNNGAGPPRPRRRRGWLVLVVLLIVAGAVVWRLRSAPAPQSPAGRAGRDAPTQVVAAAVKKGDIHVRLSALGTVTSLATVTVKTQISGQLTRIDFKEGQEVKKGDSLVEID